MKRLFAARRTHQHILLFRSIFTHGTKSYILMDLALGHLGQLLNSEVPDLESVGPKSFMEAAWNIADALYF